MRNLRALLPVLVAGIFMLMPLGAQAATADFFGPIIPSACHCPLSAPDWGCVVKVLQNLINLGISIGVMIFVLVAAYAGFLWMTSSMNPHNREMGRSMLLNAVIGLIIALSCWLIVDFVMKALYNPNAGFGAWNDILSGNESATCLRGNNPPVGQAPDGGTLSDGTEFPNGARVSCLYPGGGVGNRPGTVVGRDNETQPLLSVRFDGETDPRWVSPGDCDHLQSTGTGTGANCPAADPSGMVAFPSEVVENGEAESATQETVNNFMAMRAAAAQAGITLIVRDGYRSDAEQVTEWNRCQSGGCVAAKPCSLGGGGSNHGSGRAIDIVVGCNNGQSGCNTPTYNWLKNNGAQWGFRNAIANDPVHWSPSGR